MDRTTKGKLRSASLGALIGLSVLFPGPVAHAHDWYGGTSDPETRLGCCGGDECAPIDARDVSEERGGFRYRPTGEFIPQSRVQRSRDFRFHRCVYRQTLITGPGKLYREGETRCFFAPPGLT